MVLNTSVVPSSWQICPSGHGPSSVLHSLNWIHCRTSGVTVSVSLGNFPFPPHWGDVFLKIRVFGVVLVFEGPASSLLELKSWDHMDYFWKVSEFLKSIPSNYLLCHYKSFSFHDYIVYPHRVCTSLKVTQGHLAW